MSSCYDIIIVGAGIAGLRIGLHIVNTNPKIKCCILEKYNYNGGRIVTYHKQIPKVGKIQWEIGAGRISTSHKKVLHLMKSYGLTYESLSPKMEWKDTTQIQENNFSNLCSIYLEPLKGLPSYMLHKYTLKELLFKIIGENKTNEFMIKFPYYCELYTLRADIALTSFDSEMKSNEGFGVCKEGLSEIIQHMANEFTEKGGIILQQIEVKKVENINNESLIHCIEECDKIKNKRKFLSKLCVFALHSEAIKKIEGINHLSVLNHLSMMPLVRMYAVFPVHQKKSWFSDLSNIVTSSPIRYIIPIDPSKGIIMISYTDGADAEFWIRYKKETIQTHVMREIRELFPDRNIPDPIFFKIHTWIDGCTYWLPGVYDVEEESYKSLHPLPKSMPNVFMCGESFSEKQCWMESALHQADKLIDHPEFKLALKAFK